MVVKKIHKGDSENGDAICSIELNVKEAESILHSLVRTMCKGEHLTVSMELEDKLIAVLKPYRQ